jgi:hypothetical protein
LSPISAVEELGLESLREQLEKGRRRHVARRCLLWRDCQLDLKPDDQPAASELRSYRRRSRTRYATSSAAGKKKRLKTKNRKKLCPFRLATRAGQNAIAIQMMNNKIPPSHQPTFEARSIAYLRVM